jgi:2-polyprenyl-3-methyl-5-hydroxy-6-metoxy-1,4-benzoquinol methylase
MQAENAPFLHQVSAEIGVPEANLVAVLEIERKFHVQIFTATDPAVRRRLYADVYARVHPLLEADTPTDSRYTNLVRLFRRELQGKSIMDVGCGRGELLLAVHAAIPHGELCGLDTSSTHQPNGTATVVFLQRDIVDFRVEQSFDVVFSNQVLEHIAPADLPAHLQSIRRALKPGGTFICCLPNRLWGPSDVTRIVDYRCRGLTAPQGTHLNESAYSELALTLRAHGFSRIRTVLPFAIPLAAVSRQS